ncbi:archease, partial [Candidatus Parcubacteria bacterium]|nr:archease [Candidatus Parcubacteria bacterium]
MYKYLEHEADMGVYAQAESWPEVFSEGARAVFSLMYEKEVRSKKLKVRSIKIEVGANSIEGLFVEWINELLAQKDINSLVFFKFEIDKIDQA